MAVSEDSFLEGMSRAASGVSAVTSSGSNGVTGKTISSMCSLSASPPSLLVCIYRDSETTDIISANKKFAVNIFAENHFSLAQRLAGLKEDNKGKFHLSADWFRSSSGGVILRNAVVAFECALAKRIDYATHAIFIGQVNHIFMHKENVAPLVYNHRRFCAIDYSSK